MGQLCSCLHELEDRRKDAVGVEKVNKRETRHPRGPRYICPLVIRNNGRGVRECEL